jgi:trimethylguanosine synthase
MIILDAFCGCGGNAIAFAKQPQISLVVCADIDRSKLSKAAYNACLYEIPKEKLIFVECSSLFLLEHCYQNGALCLENLRQATNLPTVDTEVCAGFFIGGLGMPPTSN